MLIEPVLRIRSVEPVLPGRVIGRHLLAHEAKYGSDVGGAGRRMDSGAGSRMSCSLCEVGNDSERCASVRRARADIRRYAAGSPIACLYHSYE